MMDLSTSERFALINHVSGLPPAQFSGLVYALKPPSGVVPPSPAPVGDRAVALLDWVEGPTGPKINKLLELLGQVAPLPSALVSPPPSPNPLLDNTEVISSPPQKTIKVSLLNGVILEMVYIPPGVFFMGSPEHEKERFDWEGPQHKVKVPGFYMGKYPVTQDQWYSVSLMDDVERHLSPALSSFKGATHPVEQVNWYDATEFCQRLSNHTGQHYRLPSEAEWEYACRANTLTRYFFGDELAKDQANFNVYVGETTPVGQYPANAFDLHDMHGNVWEWCQDHWHQTYKGAPSNGSAWLENPLQNNRRVCRGGSWDFPPRFCRSASRLYLTPDYQPFNLGFRVVLAPR